MMATLQLLVLVALAFAVGAGLLLSLAMPLVDRWTRDWAPASRHRALVMVGVAPAGLTFAAIVAVILPSLLALEWPSADHCSDHDGHAHLCLIHGSEHGLRWASAVVFAIALWAAARVTLAMRELGRASALVRGLVRASTHDPSRCAWIVPTDRALCLSAGLLRPRVLISRGLVDASAPVEQAVMLAHEAAHGRRKDTLARLIVRAATVTLLPSRRRSLLHALELSAERACDEIAAIAVGDRVRVAETLVAMERRLMREGGPLVAGFGPSAVPERVEAMLRPPQVHGACSALGAALGGAVVALLAAYDAIHHTTESVVAHLIG